MRIDRLDHFVLTCRDVEATIRFYQSALGMEPVTFGAGRRALAYGRSKINLHDAKAPVSPHATHPVPGSADLCFIAEGTIDDVIAHLHARGIAVEQGPVPRTGALGPISSVYLRDPDGNLVEISTYPPA